MNVNGETPKTSLVMIRFIIQLIANHYQFMAVSASKKMSWCFLNPSSNRPGNHLPAPNRPRLKVRVEEEIVGVPNGRVSPKNPATFTGRMKNLWIIPSYLVILGLIISHDIRISS